MKRVLILGWTNHSLFHELYKRLYETSKSTIRFDALSITPIGDWDHVYFENIFEGSFDELVKGPLKKIPKIRSLLYYNRLHNLLRRIISNYDVIHFHYLFNHYKTFNAILKKFNGKKVLTVWGSDFLRREVKNEKWLINFVGNMDYVTFANPDIRKEFNEYYYKNNLKYLDVRFGISLLDIELDNNIQDLKAKYGFPSDKILVFVGTNGSKYQQHLKILKNLNKLSRANKERLFLVMHLGYGLDKNYLESIKSLLLKIEIKHRIVETFLSGKELLQFRQTADVLIQCQTSDSLSGAMQEHLYANSIVITGTWLPYSIFNESGIKWIQIDNLEDLSFRMSYIINNIGKLKLKNTSNATVVKQISSWQSNLGKWKSLYF